MSGDDSGVIGIAMVVARLATMVARSPLGCPAARSSDDIQIVVGCNETLGDQSRLPACWHAPAAHQAPRAQLQIVGLGVGWAAAWSAGVALA